MKWVSNTTTDENAGRSERERTARELARTKVKKTLRPGQSGAIKLTRKYGSALVCVRHRQDPKGLVRYVTVELMVSQHLIHAKHFIKTRHGIQLHYREKHLRMQLIAAGARWDPKTQLWWLIGAKLLELGLLDRVSTSTRRGTNINRQRTTP